MTTTTTYASLKNRIKAVFIDALVLVGLGLLASNLLGKFEDPSDSVRLFTFVFIFLLYDPLFTSIAGGTIGHLFSGLGVRREKDEQSKIGFALALVRFILKAFLGWISLLTITGNKKGKAIHDSVVGSVVINYK